MRLKSIVLKKGGGGMKKTMGGGVPQNQTLAALEIHLGKTAKDTATALGVSYNTYKEWKGDRRKMTGSSRRLVAVIYELKGTKIGEMFGV